MADYILEADPTNTYLSTNVGNPQAMIWDETTQSGENLSVLYYDDAESLTFINTPVFVTIQPYASGSPDTGYAYLYWDAAAADGSVTVSIDFYTPASVIYQTVSATNTASEGGDATSAIVLLPSAVATPAGGAITVTFTHNGTPTTFTIGGEIYLDYAAKGRRWWLGVTGWG